MPEVDEYISVRENHQRSARATSLSNSTHKVSTNTKPIVRPPVFRPETYSVSSGDVERHPSGTLPVSEPEAGPMWVGERGNTQLAEI